MIPRSKLKESNWGTQNLKEKDGGFELLKEKSWPMKRKSIHGNKKVRQSVCPDFYLTFWCYFVHENFDYSSEKIFPYFPSRKSKKKKKKSMNVNSKHNK